MAILAFRIPDAAFTSGGRFDGMDKNTVAIPCFIKSKENGLITSTPYNMEDWAFKPPTPNEMQQLMDSIDNGTIEVRLAGAVQTAIELKAVHDSFWQDY